MALSRIVMRLSLTALGSFTHCFQRISPSPTKRPMVSAMSMMVCSIGLLAGFFSLATSAAAGGTGAAARGAGAGGKVRPRDARTGVEVRDRTGCRTFFDLVDGRFFMAWTSLRVET